MLKRARDFFERRGILEVDTPILGRFGISDPHIESIEVTLRSNPGRTWYLQTSPEHCMKRLLCAGYPDIYEICKVFRDGEFGRYHQPEFTLVEWYRLNFALKDIMQDAVDLISSLVDSARFAAQPRFLTYRQAFLQFAGIDPLTAELAALVKAVTADAGLEDSLGKHRDDWLDLALSEKVAPQFDPDRLTVLYHYPASQAALARLCPEDPEVADRFEVFAGPLELANGYVELIDPREQTNRFAAERRRRLAAAKPDHQPDPAFILALEAGLPPCAGVAVGFDRLHILNEGAEDIRTVLSFPFDPAGDHA